LEIAKELASLAQSAVLVQSGAQNDWLDSLPSGTQ
jgi:hypothetical protein